MDLKTIMQYHSFAVIGDTSNPEKYAYRIANELKAKNYIVYEVGKTSSINDIKNDVEVIDLCINPVKGLAILQSNQKHVQAVLIQPGAESKEIKDFLHQKGIPFLEGCALVGLRLYKNI